MGRKNDDKFKQAEQFNAAANNTANQIPAQTTATAQYMAPRALERLKALDAKGSEALHGYELFDPEQFAEREDMRRTGIETLNAPLTNANYMAAISQQLKDTRMRDRANHTLGAYQAARGQAMSEAYTAEGDTRSAMSIQLQGQLGAAGNQTNLASAYNNRRRWYDPLLGMAQTGASVASGLGSMGVRF
jgi:hypothetical protein